MSKPTVAERIKILYEYYGDGNMSAFARSISVNHQTVRDLIKGEKGGPSWPVLQNILQSYPDVRLEWLIQGEGEMLSSPKSSKNNSVYETPASARVSMDEEPAPYRGSDNLRVLTVQVGEDNNENIEMVPMRAAAGYAAGGFTQEEFIRKLPSFRLPGAAYRNGSFRCFQVHGNSMQGTLQDGDWLICRYVEKWAHDIQNNEVYVVVSEQDVLVKRVLNQLNERGRLTLHSDNPSFDVQFMDWRDVREVWMGVARLTQDLTNTHFDIPVELAHQQASIAELFQRLEN